MEDFKILKNSFWGMICIGFLVGGFIGLITSLLCYWEVVHYGMEVSGILELMYNTSLLNDTITWKLFTWAGYKWPPGSMLGIKYIAAITITGAVLVGILGSAIGLLVWISKKLKSKYHALH